MNIHMLSHSKILIQFISLIMLLIALPAFIRPDQPVEGKEDVPKLINDLQRENPDYIFIGNSMLNSRIDKGLFDDLTKKKCFLLWRGGSESAVWYLMLKNGVIPSDIKPKMIFIFFRDTNLTESGYRTEGKYKRYIETFSSDNEITLNKILAKNKTPLELFKQKLVIIYPILSGHPQERMSKNIEKFINFTSQGRSRKFNVSEINEILDYKHSVEKAVNEEIANSYKINYDFKSTLPDSFLPHIIQMIKSIQSKPVFIRVQRRPIDDKPPVQSEELKKYIIDLKSYLSKQDCIYYDFTGDPRLKLSMYRNGDHIDAKFTKEYTTIFVDTLKDMFK